MELVKDRDQNGRFVKGNKASPGRAKRVVEVDFHNILLDNVSAEQWSGIVKRAVTDALAGDKYARQFIADYTIGKAPSILELRAADATLLAQVLERFKQHDMEAADVFHAMLAQFAAEESEQSA